MHINTNLVQRFLAGFSLAGELRKFFSPGPEPTLGGPVHYLHIFRNLIQLKLSP
jgi:hypothetical protein